MPLWLLSLFVLIVCILAAIAAYLHWQLHRKRQQLKLQQLHYENNLKGKKREAATSIEVIARCYIDDQVELGEAALRLHHLLQYFDFDESTRNQVRVFDEVANRIAHIPILDAWKSLDKESKAQHRQTMENLENEFSAFAKDAAQKLLDLNLTRKD